MTTLRLGRHGRRPTPDERPPRPPAPVLPEVVGELSEVASLPIPLGLRAAIEKGGSILLAWLDFDRAEGVDVTDRMGLSVCLPDGTVRAQSYTLPELRNALRSVPEASARDDRRDLAGMLRAPRRRNRMDCWCLDETSLTGCWLDLPVEPTGREGES